MKEVGKVNSPTAEGYYLSDGHVNLAILKFKYDDGNVEVKFTGPDGVTIDLSEHGWLGTK